MIGGDTHEKERLPVGKETLQGTFAFRLMVSSDAALDKLIRESNSKTLWKDSLDAKDSLEYLFKAALSSVFVVYTSSVQILSITKVIN